MVLEDESPYLYMTDRKNKLIFDENKTKIDRIADYYWPDLEPKTDLEKRWRALQERAFRGEDVEKEKEQIEKEQHELDI